MKKVFKILIFSLFTITTYAQQATEIDSKSVRLPRYASEAAVTAAIPTPTQGMLIYRTDTKSNWYFDGTVWKDMVVSSVSVPSPLYLTSTSTTIVGETNQADEAGVMGVNTTDGVSFGVLGRASHNESLDGGAGVKGENLSTNESGYGVMGTHNGVGWAGYFEGYNALKTLGNTYLNGNVGIGTDSPWGKLAINTQGANHNVPSLLLTDDASNNEGGAILQFRNLADKRMYLQSHFGTQSNGTDSYLTFSHNATYNMRLRGDGNLGIGSINPNLAGLVVNKKVGNSHAIFGDNTSGVSIESNFPGIHFNSYFNGSRKTISTGYAAGIELNNGSGGLSIYTSPNSSSAGNTIPISNRIFISKDGNVGINNNNPLNKLEVGGDFNTTGLIKVNGNAGNAGQVLTSNGATDPTWENATFNNDIRFSVIMKDMSSNLNEARITDINYNTNPAMVVTTINNRFITINKSGLYHFDFNLKCRTSTTGNGNSSTRYPAFQTDFKLSTGSALFYLSKAKLNRISDIPNPISNKFIWETSEKGSFNFYISAPVAIEIPYYLYIFESNVPFFEIELSGNLISE